MRGILFVMAPVVVATMALGTHVSAQSVARPTIHRVTLHEGSGVITITGVGFGRDPVVNVDGQPVVVLQGGSETHLDVLAPAALLITPGTYRLTVQDPVTRAGDAFEIPSQTGSPSAANADATRGSISSDTTAPAGEPRGTVATANAPTEPSRGGLTPHLIENGNNTALGVGALDSNTTGANNSATGYSALTSNTTGNENTASGVDALHRNTNGHQNTATGVAALYFNTTGHHNTATGVSALSFNTTGFYNTASGVDALYSNTTGVGNTASGMAALYSNTGGQVNTAIGLNALHDNTTGAINTASGAGALLSNTTGSQNTASGMAALTSNTTGSQNTASGAGALLLNTTGAFNTANGRNALLHNSTGFDNTAVGNSALDLNSTGKFNTAVGSFALSKTTTGNRNTALGYNAGKEATIGSYNLFLGAGVFGTAADTNTIRIGLPGVQNQNFIAGIRSITTGMADAIPVVIDSAGQLGTVSSSRRFKEDIQDMADASADILRLRPVTFRYTQAFAGGAKPQQYGLIAEEVAEVYPDLVVHSPDGQVETVQYDKVYAMLLNEVQKQHRALEAQAAQIRALTEQLTALAARLQGMEAQRFSTDAR